MNNLNASDWPLAVYAFNRHVCDWLQCSVLQPLVQIRLRTEYENYILLIFILVSFKCNDFSLAFFHLIVKRGIINVYQAYPIHCFSKIVSDALQEIQRRNTFEAVTEVCEEPCYSHANACKDFPDTVHRELKE